MKAATKVVIVVTLGAVFCLGGRFVAGMVSGANEALKPAAPVGSKWVETKEAEGVKHLPAVPAPTSRTNPEFEATIARKCTYASQVAQGMYEDALSKDLSSDALDRLIIGSSGSLEGNAKLLHNEIIRQIGYYLMNANQYTYTKVQLMNYAYQYCDLRTHQFFEKGE